MSRTRPQANGSAPHLAAAKTEASAKIAAVIEQEISLPESEFADFGRWMDEQLAALELRHESYVTADSLKRNLRRGR